MWQEFESGLARRLRLMRPGEFLVLGYRDHPDLYVQFRVDEDGPLYAECRGPVATSRFGRKRVPEPSPLEQLGWLKPERKHFPNHRRYWPANPPPNKGDSSAPSDDDIREAANLATRSLRDVLGVPSPSNIEEQAGS